MALWRRRRDLNPRSGFPDYSLSRGAPSATWVLLQVQFYKRYLHFLLKVLSQCCRKRSGGESGIRTHGSCESPVFKTGSLNHSDISPQAERHQAHQTRVLSYHIRRAMSTVFRKKPGPRGPGPFPVTRKMRARQLWSRRAGSAVPNCWAIYWDLQNTGCFLPL